MPWAAAAAAVGGAVIGASASKSAASKQAGAANSATQAQLAMFDSTRGDLAPWAHTGNLSLDRLGYLLGVNSGIGGGKDGQPGQGKDVSGDLFTVGDSGAPTVNQERYARDPIYRQVWDAATAEHRAKFGLEYTADSDKVIVENHLRQKINEERARRGIQDPAIAARQQVENDPEFGSLAKPFTLADFQESPAYQFNLQQGQKAIDKAAASRKMFYAPSTLQDISKFSQGTASNEFNNAYNMFNQNQRNIWDRFYAMSGSGQNAAAQTGAFGTQVGGQVGNNMTGAGNASAAGSIGAANAFTNAGSQAYNSYMMNQILQNSQRSSYTGTQGNSSLTGAGDLNSYFG
jgi:hypothetical protein